jgi:hypothetical protein
MSIELLRFQTERLLEKQGRLEKMAAGYFARVDKANEAALAKLRKQDEALLAPYQAPTRDPAGHFEAAPGAPTDERSQFARNKANMLAGLRGAG